MKTKCRLKIMQFAMIAAFLFNGLPGVFGQEVDAEIIDPDEYLLRYGEGEQIKPVFFALRSDLGAKEKHLLDTLTQEERNSIEESFQPPAVGVIRDLKQTVSFYLNPADIPMEGDMSVAGGRLTRINKETLVFTTFFQSLKADEIRVFFAEGNFPEGVQVNIFSDNDYAFTQTELSGKIDEYGFYTTTTFADHLTLQVVIPLEQLDEELYFVISRIIHVDNSYLPEEFRSCYLDANCSTANSYTHIEGLRNSTGRLYFPVGSLYYLCTGNQVNDIRAKDWQPFLLTANHCFSTQTSAAGLEARFYYWSTSCNSGVVNPSHIIRNGANLIATNSQTDFTLVLLKQYGASSFLGWSASSVANNTVLHSTHHPGGTLLKYQRMQNKTSPGFSCTGFSTANYHYTQTTHGQESGGSSGSATVDADLRIRGQLYGWCYLDGADKCDYDTYYNMWGRFDVTYNNNNLQYWLYNGGASVAMATSPSSSHNYGNVSVGSFSNLTVTVTNTGTRPNYMNLQAGSATLSGTHASQFSIIGGNYLYLAPGESGTFTVRFTPTSTGTKTATFTIPHNADNIASPRTITLTGTGASAPNPCANIISLGSGGSGNAKTYSKSGTGVWNVTACGYTTSGQEQVYSFVAPYTGNYSIQVTSTNNTWVDYFWKTGTCGSTGWTCISDVYSPNTYGNISMTAGTTYYILLDAEGTGTATHTFHIFRNPCLNIVSLGAGGSANTVTYSRSGYGGWTSNACGYNCFGQEQIYSFVAPYTGNYSIQVTATNSTYVDYFWKSGTCNADNWNCIDDVFYPGTYGNMSLTAGTTYYFLVDAEGTALATQSFFVFFNPCLNITPIAGTGPSNTQTYTGGGSGAWNTTTASPCGYFCPGIENIYSFTPAATGIYPLEVTAASGWVDYMWKSGSCSSEDWECISDIISPGVYGYLNMTAGTTYYFLLDDENATPGTHEFFIGNVIPPGTWIGIANSDWHNPVNWSDGVVPTASTSVTIPAGTTYMPVLTANATCSFILLKENANLTINAAELTVSSSFQVYGTLNMNNSGAILTVGQTHFHQMTFYSGSLATLTAGTINCYGWVVPREGSTFNPSNNVTFYFKGVSGGGPSNFSPTATFSNIIIAKNSGENAYFDASATQPLVVTGNFTVSPNNTFAIQNHTMEVNGVFTDNSTSQVYLSTLSKNIEGISSDADFEMSDTPGFRGGVLEIDTDFTLNGLLNVADGDALVHGRFASNSTSSILINGGTFISDAPNHPDKGWQYLDGNLTMDDGLFEITHNSVNFGATASTAISGGTIKSGGAFYATATGVFQPTGGVVEITGNNPDVMIYCYNDNYFYDLRINRSGGNSRFGAGSAIQNNLYVDNGELRLLASSNLTVAGNVEINSGGKLFVGNQAKLLMGSSRSVTVNNGGILELAGTSPTQQATLTRISTGYYALNIESGGTIAAQNAIFEYGNSNGVHIKSGGMVDATKAFTNCTFQQSQPGGTLLLFHNNQTLEIVNANFPSNTWGGGYNVYKNLNLGNVTFTDYTGAFSGSAFEYDPYNRIHWAVDAFTLTFSVENVAGDLIPDAVITLAGTTYPAGDYVFNDLVPGTYNYSITSDCYTTATGQVVISGSNVLQEVTLENVYGDANGDGIVNVSDIVLIVNYFMDEEPAGFCFFNADINGDDIINVQDVVGTVNIFMSGKTMPWLALSSETAYLHLRSDGIWLESDGTLAGIQFELTPAQMNEMQLSAELPDHFLMQKSTDDYLKAIVFSIDNTPFPAGMIKLVSFEAMENMPGWREALAANLNAISVPIELLTEATLTDNPHTDSDLVAYPNPTDNVLWVEFVNRSGNQAIVSLSNMHAQLVKVQSAEKQGRINMNFKMNDLAPGIYMIRVEMGDEVLLKKIIVK